MTRLTNVEARFYRISPSELQKLDTLAIAAGLTREEVLRELLEDPDILPGIVSEDQESEAREAASKDSLHPEV